MLIANLKFAQITYLNVGKIYLTAY